MADETTVCENQFLPVNRVVSLTVDASGVSPVDSSGSQASFPALTQRGEGPLTVSNSRVSRGHPAAQFPQRQQQQAIDQQSDKLNKFEDKPVELQYIKHIKEDHPPTPQNIHKLGLQNNEKPGEYIFSRHSNPNVSKTQSSSSVNTSDASPARQLTKDTRLSHINPYFKVTCTLCGILYSHKRYLTRHMSAHGANKKYPCSLCTCSFTQTGNLRRHIDGHKANNIMAQRQELPSISGNSGDTSLAFQLSKDTLKSRFNPYFRVTCSLCSISYSNPGFLTRHMKAHGGNQRYKCSKCSKLKCSYTKASNLVKHLLAHKASMPSNNIILSKQQDLPSSSAQQSIPVNTLSQTKVNFNRKTKTKKTKK